MRDYKHVTVPRRHRPAKNKAVTRRVDTGADARKRRPSGAGGSVAVALGIMLSVALCYGGWEGYRWLTTAEQFQVAGVDVKGVRRAGEAEAREAAALFTGQNIFRVDPAAAVRRALENPWVRDVRIERSLPNRISMTYTERTPRAVLAAANGRYLMDTESVVIMPLREGDAAAAGLPSIAVSGWRAAPRAPVTGGALPEALELLDELGRRGGWEMSGVTVRADSAETITVLYAGHEFRIGSGNYDEKLRRLGEIVSDMNRRGLSYTYVELRPERQAAVMVINNGGKGQGPGVRKKRGA